MWKWEGKKIEEVNLFKYLGFICNKQGNDKDHIAELKKKGLAAAKNVGSRRKDLQRGF